MDWLSQWILSIIDNLGSVGIALMMFLENVFPPIPSELIMPAAGFAASLGKINLLMVIIAGTVGSVLGALPLYYLGSKFDEVRLLRLVNRYGKYLLISPQDIQNSQRWFDKYGKSVVFFGRMIPAIRSLISIPAGMARMPLLPFLILTAIGSFLWSTLLAYAGFVLAANYQKVAPVVESFGRYAAIIIGILVLYWLIKRIKQVYQA
ncbi:membrane protein DedA, SNARE-associated domain [Moraxella cuniculi DSM 21768]|uniref:Membrane protein DedA, SNARE-associated domain n=1 Tax=Moraxella cuniculi DSM 21768 TaxID=1122245 RepID=A0A1N7G289_9GAMM|nr:DedA family protein [Moraxella cuniculi]OOS05165.1 alkaline phosphatase [Moraxella cuniculi]SIS06687.1 membrane protein DedA, SNARE-associated domain [Moraxella cuniculi DSM 21768]